MCFWKWVSCRINAELLPELHKAQGHTRVASGYRVPCPQLPSSAPAVQPVLYSHYLNYQGHIWKEWKGLTFRR